MLLLELQTHDVMFQVRKVRETLDESEHEEHRRVNPDGDAGVALLELEESRPADRSTLRRNRHRYAPPSASVADVAAKLSEGMPDRDGELNRCAARP